MKPITKLILSLAGISAAIAVIGLTQTCRAQGQTAPERIGVYDSRAIAVAYAGSDAHNQELRALMAERDKAKAAGDKEKVAKIEAEGKAGQKKAHKQAFSTEPVDEILLRITNDIPQIKKDAGVTALVSKWNQEELKKHPGAQQVDVTMKLVDAFHPTERSRKWAVEIQEHKPISLEDAEKIND